MLTYAGNAIITGCSSFFILYYYYYLLMNTVLGGAQPKLSRQTSSSNAITGEQQKR